MIGTVTTKHTTKLRRPQRVEEKFGNILGAYMSPGSGCVDKKHFVVHVELVFGCLS